MDNHKKIFSEILEELNITKVIKSSLLEKIDQVNIETYGDYTHSDRQCIVQCIVEERWKEAVESEIRKLKRKKLISAFKKKFISGAVNFQIIEKETYELNFPKLSKFKKNPKKSEDKIEVEKIELNLSDKYKIEKNATWQKVIDNQKQIKEGYIYILSNKELPNIYKIGFVKEDVVKRAYSFKRETKLTTDFIIEKIWKTKNPFEVEQKIFKSLEMPTNEKGEFDSSLGKCYRNSKFINGKRFFEFVDGASLKFFCKRIEEFIQE